jgi:CxxC motif-containing protein (DUF1111 family)
LRTAAILVLVTAWLGAQNGRPLLPGDALPGVTPFEFELFLLGLDDFLEVETPAEGLGPAFNGRSCAECHSIPAIGGITAMTETRAGRREEDGSFTELNGGTLFHLFSIPTHACQVRIPPEANVFARRMPIPLFGAGLVEAIPDGAIVALEDPDDRDGDGVSGRAARIIDVGSGQSRVGRFGWKAQHATLLAFASDAYRNEMGITNDLFRNEVALGLTEEEIQICAPGRGLEDAPDRLTKLRGIDNFANFMRFLAPLERGAEDDVTRAGEGVFHAAGCAACHIPVQMTGPNSNPLFDGKSVNLFSDLLLHDVGTGDGIVQDGALANEIRTPALWGLRLRRPMLHDGSVATPRDAILRHGGEASAAVQRFLELSDSEREWLLRFLDSL